MIRSAFVLFAVLTAVTGFAYPVVVAGVARVAFPAASRGSVVRVEDRPVGSGRVGQPFSDPRYVWGRPSATTPVPYDGRASAASNLAPGNPALVSAVRARVAALRAADPGNAAPIPVDLVMASGSGLDPDVSPAAALYQVDRVANARGLPREAVRGVVEDHLERPFLGLFGAPRVNVLALNLALDGLSARGVDEEDTAARGPRP